MPEKSRKVFTAIITSPWRRSRRTPHKVGVAPSIESFSPMSKNKTGVWAAARDFRADPTYVGSNSTI
jgi:hypothetical protein